MFFKRLIKNWQKPSASAILTPKKEQAETSTTAETFLTHGNSFIRDERFTEAADCYRKAIQIDPNNAIAHVLLGHALIESGQPDDAHVFLCNAVVLQPENIDAHYMLGCIAKEKGDDAQVAHELEFVIRKNPKFEFAYSDLCFSLFRMGKFTQAHEFITQGIENFPHNAHFYFLQGNLFAETGAYQEGTDSFLQVLKLQPEHAEALANLAQCQRHLGFVDDAVQNLKKALQLQPHRATWHSNLLLTLQYQGLLSKTELFEEHLHFSKRFESPLLLKRIPHTPRDHAKKRIKLGYVSGDFRNHSLAFFIEPPLRDHDRSKFEIFCYYTFPVHDEVTQRLRSLSDHWRSCSDWSDDQLAEEIRTDGIDVLIDLSGHTGHNRLLVFARKPAPLQMTWLGYQATTGLSAMDYRITDSSMDPPGTSEPFHTEKLLRIESAACFQPSVKSPDVNSLPALTNEFFTFGSLNNPAKITPQLLEAWSEILLQTNNTRILIAGLPRSAHDAMRENFNKKGIEARRLTLQEPLPFYDYLLLHQTIDLALDTFPYNGGTTSLHGLWMGIPMVTLMGKQPVERAGSAMLGGFGLNEFITTEWPEYIQKAIYFSNNLEHLSSVRKVLRKRMATSLVQKSREFTASLENSIAAALRAQNGVSLPP